MGNLVECTRSNAILGRGILGRVRKVVPKASSMGLCRVVTNLIIFRGFPPSAKGTGSDAILGRGGGGSPGCGGCLRLPWGGGPRLLELLLAKAPPTQCLLLNLLPLLQTLSRLS